MNSVMGEQSSSFTWRVSCSFVSTIPTLRQIPTADGRPHEPIMVLGFYDHDKEWTEEEEELENKASGGDPGKIVKHHSQMYSNGSKCDLTGNLRHTEVRVRI